MKDEIKMKEWGRIEKVLWGGRKSMSLGFNLDNYARIVNNAFGDAGEIGVILADIFMSIFCQML